MNTSPNLLTETHTIATFQVDFNCKMTVPSILMLLQDVAWKHANEHNFGYRHLHEKGQFWVLAKMNLKILRYPKWTDTLRLETWSKPPELLTAYRDFEGLDEQGNVYFSATSAWHILSITGNRPQPLNDLAIDFPHLTDRHSIAEKPAKIASPENATTVAEYIVQPSDIDMHQHVNNTRYIQWIIDSFGFDFLQHNSINSLEINFLAQTKANDAYTITTANIGDNAYVSCIFNKMTGKELVRAKTIWQGNL